MMPLEATLQKSHINEYQKQEALYEKRFREGGCTFGDMNHKRHRDTYYITASHAVPNVRIAARFGLTENRRVFYTS